MDISSNTKKFSLIYILSLLAYSVLGRIFGGNTDGGLNLSLLESLIRGSLLYSSIFSVLFVIPCLVAISRHLLNKNDEKDIGKNLMYAITATWVLSIVFLYFQWYGLNVAN